MIDSEYVTREQAAKILRVNVRTVDRYAIEGLLARYARLKRTLFLRQEVESLGEPKPDAPTTQTGENRRDWL